MTLISTHRKSKTLIAAAALSQIGNFGAVVPDTNFADLSGSPRSSHTSLRLVGANAKHQAAKDTAPVLVEEFDASEFPAGWKITNTGTLDLPRATLNKDSYPGLVAVGVKGTYLSTLSTNRVRSAQPVDFGWTGRIESPEFTIERRFINFHIGGGNVPDETSVSLEVKEFDGTWSKVASSTGSGNTGLIPDFFPVKQYNGKTARLVVEDKSNKPMGYMALDSVEMADYPRRSAQLSFRDVGLRPNYVNSAVCYTNDVERREGRWIDLGLSERQLNARLNKITKVMDSSAMPLVPNETPANYGMRIRVQTDKAVLSLTSHPSSDLKDYAFFWGANCMVGAKIPYASEYFQKTGKEKGELQEPVMVLKVGRSICGGTVLLTREALNHVFKNH